MIVTRMDLERRRRRRRGARRRIRWAQIEALARMARVA